MNNSSEQPKFLTPDELSARWDGAITVGTLANWRSRKQGPPFQKFGARVRYPLDGVVAYEASNRHDNDNNLTAAKGAA